METLNVKNLRLALWLAGAVALSAAAAQADTIVGSGSWQSWTAGSLNESGNIFWDNHSYDGPHQNVGYYTLPATPNYYGNSDGTAVNNESFNRGSSSGTIQASELEAIAGYAPDTSVGWYDTSNPSVLHTIWTAPGTQARSADESFTPSADWGLYLECPGGTFYSNSALNSPGDNSQHFAIFTLDSTPGAEEYQIGIEDTAFNTGNYEGVGDFNDFVMTLQSEPGTGAIPTTGATPTTGTPTIPEPTSLSTLGFGAICLLIRRRKVATMRL